MPDLLAVKPAPMELTLLIGNVSSSIALQERKAEIMAVTLDIFDQEKVWDMALKAERREGREEGIEKGIEEGREKGREEGAAGIIRICRQMMHLDDQAIIQILMKEMNLPQNRAVAILSNYDHPSSNPD